MGRKSRASSRAIADNGRQCLGCSPINSMNPDQLFQLLLVVVAGAIGVSGTLLGSHLDRRRRDKERQADEISALHRVAAETMGETGNHLISINPEGNVGMAEGLDVDVVVGALTEQADYLRPALAILSIRWPEQRRHLINLLSFIRFAPTRLDRILRRVREGANPQDISDYSGLVTDTDAAMRLWNDVVRELDSLMDQKDG